MAPFAGEEDDEDLSLSGTSGSGVHGSPLPRSVRQDFPLVMTMAAERVGLPPQGAGPHGHSMSRHAPP